MHFKLFEEFSNRFIRTNFYQQTKELPEQGCINNEDDDQLKALQLALFKQGYSWSGSKEVVPYKDLTFMSRSDDEYTMYWYVLKTSSKKKLSMFSPGLKIPPEEIDFDEYFEPLDSYKGSHAGKKYGI